MPDTFIVSTSPHIRREIDTGAMMRLVCVALLPAAAAAVWIFGLSALYVMLVSVATCVLTELLCNRIFQKPTTVLDGSAAVTGILFAFTLPPTTPLWMTAVGGFLAVFVAKELFGGLGYNIFNPALAARAILLASWPVAMTTWAKPVRGFAEHAAASAAQSTDAVTAATVDAVTAATQLSVVKGGEHAAHAAYGNMDLFLGTVPGSLGETCKIALLLGALLLFIFKVIEWRIPVMFIGTVALLSLPMGRNPLTEVLSGGLILGAFFMATDLVTSPVTKGGKIIFGAGCGVVTILIRRYGGFPEGVCYSILFMNCLVPLIDKCVQPRVFGTKRAWFC